VPSNRLEDLENTLVNLDKPNHGIINKTVEKFSVKASHIRFSNTLHGEIERLLASNIAKIHMFGINIYY
jgi:hypothetical protein